MLVDVVDIFILFMGLEFYIYLACACVYHYITEIPTGIFTVMRAVDSVPSVFFYLIILDLWL